MASVITIVINMNMIFGENYSYNSKDYVNKGTLEKEMNTADVKMIKSIKDDSFYRTDDLEVGVTSLLIVVSIRPVSITVLFRGK